MMAIVLSAAMSEGMVSRRDLFLLAVLAMAAAAAGSQSAWSLVGVPALQMDCSIDAAEAEQSAATA